MHVLDSSAFIHEYHTDNQTASIPMVQSELEGEHAFRFDAMEGAGMHIHIPAEGTVEKVVRAAGETGDGDVLSDTDIRLVAAAFELSGTLVTDDYAMQNVASRLDVPVETVGRDGIEEEREWRWQCVGCGRTFDDDEERCPICGSDLTRKR